MIKTPIIIVFLISILFSFSCINFDARQTKIGTQVWTTANLNVSTFRNGDTIPEIKGFEEWLTAGKEEKPAWCYYDNDTLNGKKYGKLYNWYAVNDKRGLAPEGWHIPSDEEWKVLTDYLGGDGTAAIELKSDEGWAKKTQFRYASNGTNVSGFAGLPGGFRGMGFFVNEGEYGYWWSSTEYGNSGQPHCRYMSYNDSNVGRWYKYRASGLSVRCLKD